MLNYICVSILCFMSKIRLLPEKIINLIAAGEVVERPASVVKELIENSIDALSTRVIVKVSNAGIDYIEVIDNGTGMNKEDLKLSVILHATSKIYKAKDLEQIKTLGFRGEALASISEVSEETIIDSKTENDAGNLLVKKGKNIEIKSSNKTSNGTSVIIKNLFKNIPARKKFLKSENTEFNHIYNYFLNSALTNIDVHFELFHNSKLVLRLPKTLDLKSRIAEIFGANFALKIIESSTYLDENLSIKLFLGDPELASTKALTQQFIFINNRPVSNKVIAGAIFEGYKGFIHKEQKPVFFAILKIAPNQIDVNIHPRKLEVALNNPGDIYRKLLNLTRKTLETHTKNLISSNFAGISESPKTTNQSINIKPVTQFSVRNKNHQFSNLSATKSIIKDALIFTKEIASKKNLEFFTNQENTTKNFNIRGQLFLEFILYEAGDYLIFVDQHAASEKINFEKLVLSLKRIKTKPLLLPEIITLKPFEKQEILKHQEILKESGIIISDLGGNDIQINEIPEILRNFDSKTFVENLLDSDIDFSKMYLDYTKIYSKLSKDLYTILATTACHGSIRAGQKLTEIEMQNIIFDLNSLKNPYNCPHGRPVTWKISKSELEKNFLRKL